MVTPTVRCLLAATAIMSLAGCGLDSVRTIDHPRQAGPGENITVNLLNAFVVFSNSSVLVQGFARDSLHIGIGLPDGWSVRKISHYVSSDADVLQEMSTTADTARITEMIADSLEVYKRRSEPMAVDEGVAGFFAEKEFPLGDQAGEGAERISLDSIDQWRTYGAEIGLDFPAGAPAHTTFVLEDHPDIAAAVDSLGSMAMDTLGMSVVPIIVFVQLDAGRQTGETALYYYSKTGALPRGLQLADTDRGVLLKETITIETSDAALLGGARARRGRAYRFTADCRTGAVHVNLPAEPAGASRFEVYSPAGHLVHRCTPPTTRFVWDGTAHNGSSLPPGTYLVHYTTEGSSMATVLRLIR